MRVLAPDVVRRADPSVLRRGTPVELRGARAVADEARTFSRRRARFAETALIDGRLGAMVAPRGRLVFALVFTVVDGRITEYEVIGDRDRLNGLAVAPL
jgi:RNA polymerase sigma-70 factor (ECF subfamily)